VAWSAKAVVSLTIIKKLVIIRQFLKDWPELWANSLLGRDAVWITWLVRSPPSRVQWTGSGCVRKRVAAVGYTVYQRVQCLLDDWLIICSLLDATSIGWRQWTSDVLRQRQIDAGSLRGRRSNPHLLCATSQALGYATCSYIELHGVELASFARPNGPPLVTDDICKAAVEAKYPQVPTRASPFLVFAIGLASFRVTHDKAFQVVFRIPVRY